MFYSFQIGFSSARVYMWHEVKKCSVHFQFASTVNHDLYKYGKLICVLVCVAFAVLSRLILYLKFQVHNNKIFYFHRFFLSFSEENKYNFSLIEFNCSIETRLRLIIQIDHQLTYYLQCFSFCIGMTHLMNKPID